MDLPIGDSVSDHARNFRSLRIALDGFVRSERYVPNGFGDARSILVRDCSFFGSGEVPNYTNRPVRA